MNNIFIRYRHQKTPLDLPSNWKLLTFAAFEEHAEERDVANLTRRALNDPVRSEPLRDRVAPSDTVAIIIEDLTRASPKKLVLRALLNELEEAGVSQRNISVVISLGTHRKLTDRELSDIYGEEVAKRYEIINHNCLASDLVPVGKLKTGKEVKINRRVHEASFKIGVGSIFPHPMNGFGGGGKILFPGVADFDSILEHHLKYSFRGGLGVGQLEANAFYEEVCSITKKAGLDFIVNSVLDHNDGLYDLVCGDPLEAHLAGAEICTGIISKRFEKPADVTLITAFPYSEGSQIIKPLAPAAMVTKKGGCIILFADFTSPFPDIFIEASEAFRLKYGPNLRAAVIDHFDQNRRITEKAMPEINMALAMLLIAQDQFKIILVSKDIPKETVERLGLYYAEGPGSAFEISERFCSHPEVHVIPAGGVILPIMNGH